MARGGVRALSRYYTTTGTPLNGATKGQRLQLWKAYFNQDAKFMTVLMFPHVQTGFDIHTIYKDGGADYAQKLKWRAFIEELFVNLCEATWKIYEGVNLECEYLMISDGSQVPPSPQQVSYEKALLMRLAALRKVPDYRWIIIHRGPLLNAALRKLPMKAFEEADLSEWAKEFTKAYNQVWSRVRLEGVESLSVAY
ncbi:hypothetical protein BFW01_g1444 [Lasiodiplodia theobromae]|uniref:Uncharacterized protein n=1 Tax=Lasiodiplodia theobromae TaxID=45133 RepID=A0A8H7ISI4_9PEZI|nr:hypothetical protein BFW01_g1444 [Lasiodiplodia theobromae]